MIFLFSGYRQQQVSSRPLVCVKPDKAKEMTMRSKRL